MNPPVLSGRDYVASAHFFNDQVGFFTGRYCSVEDFYQRTYWTTDGGKTWQMMTAVKYPNINAALENGSISGSDVVNIEIVDDVYIMTIRFRHGSIHTF
jgi:hypothetical protein